MSIASEKEHEHHHEEDHDQHHHDEDEHHAEEHEHELEESSTGDSEHNHEPEEHITHTGHSHSGNFFEDYKEILSDPAHLAVEITLMIIIDVIILGILWPLFKKSLSRSIKKDHAKLDKAHGVVHHGDHIHIDSELKDCEDQEKRPNTDS